MYIDYRMFFIMFSEEILLISRFWFSCHLFVNFLSSIVRRKRDSICIMDKGPKYVPARYFGDLPERETRTNHCRVLFESYVCDTVFKIMLVNKLIIGYIFTFKDWRPNYLRSSHVHDLSYWFFVREINYQYSSCQRINYPYSWCQRINYPYSWCQRINHKYSSCQRINHQYSWCQRINHQYSWCQRINHQYSWCLSWCSLDLRF